MKRTSSRPKIVVTADGRGVVAHAGARLLIDLADATGLSKTMSDELASLRQRESGHDPGRGALEPAGMLADGGEGLSDLAGFGYPPRPVCSGPAMRGRTRPPTTSPCWTWRWRRSLTPTGTATTS